MTAAGLPRILCVDDEPNVLDGLRRQLRRQFDTITAVGGAAGLEALVHQGPFVVVVSDMQMPGVDGATFLGQVREREPDTIRVLLTGNANLDTAIAAVNHGHIFRFLTKPCPPELLIAALESAVNQHRLITAERVLLEETLRGSIKALTEILALASPAAFGRATRVKSLVVDLVSRLGLPSAWQHEIAAMLSQIGCVILPPETVENLYVGKRLTDAERAMVSRLPAVTEQLLAHIPRLEPVRTILGYQDKRFDGSGVPADRLCGEEIPVGARVLKVALDFDALVAQGLEPRLALDTLRGRNGWYDPTALGALADVVGSDEQSAPVRELRLRELRSGMVFADDVRAEAGLLLIARGQEATDSLLERIHNFARSQGVREPIRVVLRTPGPGRPVER